MGGEDCAVIDFSVKGRGAFSEDGLNINGGLFPGSPVIFIGHNKYLGWSHTVNDPDLVDVYELSINPDNEYQYQLDGQWINFERDIAKIKIKHNYLI